MREKSRGVLRGQQSSQKEQQAPGFRREGMGRGVQNERDTTVADAQEAGREL